MNDLKKRTWAEIDLDALAHNYKTLRNRVGENVKFLGVVKADAYGHGALKVLTSSRITARRSSTPSPRKRSTVTPRSLTAITSRTPTFPARSAFRSPRSGKTTVTRTA